MSVSLVAIHKDEYKDFRLEAIFNACKWDPCVADKNTLSKYVITLDWDDYCFLEKATEKLSQETIAAEAFLKDNKKHIKNLALPRYITKQLHKFKNYNPKNHVRLMRFDFHPTTKGWEISEVNSDVPAGFAEASALNEIAQSYIDSKELQPPTNFAEKLVSAVKKHVKPLEYVALVHCTAYSDDRQVVQFVGDRLIEEGINPIYMGPDVIAFKDSKAYSFQKDNNQPLTGIVRVFPIEWLNDLPKKIKWTDYFSATTMSCNHPIAIYAQTKRFPLVFDALKKQGLKFDEWEKFLPKTYDPRAIKDRLNSESIIVKPALGRVGEDVTIDGTMPKKAIVLIKKSAKRYPKHYMAQEKFISVPVKADNGVLYHVCIGAFSINGKFAGLYGRLSPSARMDRNAIDAPILIKPL